MKNGKCLFAFKYNYFFCNKTCIVPSDLIKYKGNLNFVLSKEQKRGGAMRKTSMLLVIPAIVILVAGMSFGQQDLDPNALKLSPANYRNSYVRIKDIFVHNRAGIPLALTKAGYTSQKYLTFAARNAGMRGRSDDYLRLCHAA